MISKNASAVQNETIRGMCHCIFHNGVPSAFGKFVGFPLALSQIWLQREWYFLTISPDCTGVCLFSWWPRLLLFGGSRDSPRGPERSSLDPVRKKLWDWEKSEQTCEKFQFSREKFRFSPRYLSLYQKFLSNQDITCVSVIFMRNTIFPVRKILFLVRNHRNKVISCYKKKI